MTIWPVCPKFTRVIHSFSLFYGGFFHMFPFIFPDVSIVFHECSIDFPIFFHMFTWMSHIFHIFTWISHIFPSFSIFLHEFPIFSHIFPYVPWIFPDFFGPTKTPLPQRPSWLLQWWRWWRSDPTALRPADLELCQAVPSYLGFMWYIYIIYNV